jgi:hypothetical protein
VLIIQATPTTICLVSRCREIRDSNFGFFLCRCWM